MSIRTIAVYREGVLRPSMPLPLAEDEKVELTIAPASAGDDQISIDEFFRLADEFAFGNETPGLPRDFSSADVYLDHD